MNDWCIIDEDNQAFENHTENHTNNNTKNSNEMSDEKVKYVCENCYLEFEKPWTMYTGCPTLYRHKKHV